MRTSTLQLILAALLLALTSIAVPRAAQPQPGKVYLFTSFRGNGEDGLHLAYSHDGMRWTDLGRSFLKPEVGVSKLMRDPCMLRGPDGTFHMVWTAGWEERGIGYASSRDLVRWSKQKYVEVMAHEPRAQNTWAPELAYDEARREFLIYWATTIPGRFPGDTEDRRQRNHRIYYVTTRDFETFSRARVLFDPGYSVIDSTIVQRGPGDFAMVFKDERLPFKKLRAAFSREITGPYSGISEPFTEFHTEGPSVLRLGDEWILYFDRYTQGRYGAVRTRDFKSWADVSGDLSFPRDHRHGTAFQVSPAILEGLKRGG